jgi:hypothetical protein
MFRLKHLLFVVLAGASPVAAQQATPSPAKAATPKPAASPTPASVPSLRGKLNLKSPNLGAPGSRVDAATRGDGDEIASLYVLTPETIGLTARAQPSLFWYQTKPARLPFEFALLRPGQAAPVLALRWPDGLRAGFQRLRLAEHGVSLEPNVDYQWVVALVRDPKSRSRDILSSGWIRRQVDVAPSEAWYDRLETLLDRIAASPRDPRLRAQRSALLRSVGLAIPASVDTAP